MPQLRGLQRLRRLDDDIWAADHPLKMPGGLIIGTRMTTIRLSDGGLFLHSPVPLDDELRRELGELGPVRCIVAPNKLHYLYVTEHAEAFPEARVYAAPGLAQKRKEIHFDEELTEKVPEVSLTHDIGRPSADVSDCRPRHHGSNVVNSDRIEQ